MNNATGKEGKPLVSATYASSNACMLSIHLVEYGSVLPAAFAIRPPQQCAQAYS